MSYILSFILPFIYILLFTESLCLLFKNKFEHSLPFTFIISAIIMYISLMVFKTLYVGLVINILICLVFPIYLIRKKYSIKDIKNKYLTNGVISFFVIYLLIFIYDLNRSYTRWDELSHWGKMVKEMIRLDDFYSVPSSHLLVHKDYPPMFSLMETLYALITGGFVETNLIKCMHLFEGSIIISVINHSNIVNKKNTIFKTIVLMILFYIVTFLFDSEVFINSIYIDYPMALLIGYTIYLIFKEKIFDKMFFIKLSFIGIFLLLTKQICLPLYLVILLMLIIRIIGNYKKFDIKKYLFILLMVIIIPFTFYLSWNMYKSNLNIVGQFKTSDIKVSELSGILAKTSGEDWQRESSQNYIDAVLGKNISSSYVRFTYFGVLIVLIFAYFILKGYLKDKVSNNTYLALGISLLVGFLGYTLLLYLSYVFQFGPIEGPTLASFDRYMSTYVLICLYSYIFVIVHSLNINYKYLVLVIIVLMVLIPPKQYARLRPDLIILPNHHYDEVKYAAHIIDENMNVDDKVFIVDQAEKNGAVFYINYFSDKVETNRYNYEVVNIRDSYQILRQYKYLYTYSLITNELESHKLYKIDFIDGKLVLTKVA